jgi:hypothetical protein
MSRRHFDRCALVLSALLPVVLNAQGLSNNTPSQEFIRLNGQVVAVENAVSLPAVSGVSNWYIDNIGGSTGSTVANTSTKFTVNGSGTGMIAASDQMQFGYISLNGDVSLIAHINTLQNAGTGSLVGLAVRASTDPGAPEVFIGLSGTSTTEALVRWSADSATENVGQVSGAVPEWFMIQRWGITFFVFTSTDGVNWIAPTNEVRLPMGPNACFGIVASSGSSSTITAKFDTVTLNRFPPFFSVSSGAGGLDDYFLLVNRNSGEVLNDPYDSNTDGQAQQQYGLNNSNAQQWGVLLNPNGHFTISNRGNNYGLSLTTQGGTPPTTAGSPVVISPQTYRSDQFWDLTSGDGRFVSIVNTSTGLALGVASKSVADSAALQLVTYNPSDSSQEWQIVPTGWPGIYGIFTNGTMLSTPTQVIKNGGTPVTTVSFNMPADQYEYGSYGLGAYQQYSDYAVAYAGTQSICSPAQYSGNCQISGFGDGTVLTLQEANFGLTVANTTLHVFKGPYPGTTYKLQNKNDAVNNVSLYLRWNGSSVDQGPDDGAADVHWTLVSLGNGLYNLVNQGMKLGVTGQSTQYGASLTVSSTADASQAWQFIPIDSTHFELANQQSTNANGTNMVLEVPNWLTTSGTALDVWGYDGAENKQWVLVPVS